MNRTTRLPLPVFLVALILLSFGSAIGQSRAEIDSLTLQKKALDSLLELKKSEVEQLYLIDEQLNLTTRLITKLENKQKHTESELKTLSVSVDSSRARLEQIKTGLATDLKYFYINYRPAPVAVFAAGDIQKAARQLHYFKVTLANLRAQIDSIELLRSGLEQGQFQLSVISKQTAALVERKNLEESLLELRKKEKDRLLSRIEQDVALRQQYLQTVKEDEKRLEDLTSKFASEYHIVDFVNLKGSLAWPAQGKIIEHFGRTLDKVTQTETFFPGIEIKLNPGTEITSSAEGLVAYADYLKGYGNLIILNHGDGWYTLYGHLIQISRAAGEKVGRGEIIGYSGESGSEIGPALFFGIRNREQPVDPIEWLK